MIGSSEHWTYGYNNKNELTQVKHFDDTNTLVMEADYKYDVFGNRNEKDVTIGGVTTVTKYALDGWDPAKPTSVGLENFDVFAELDGSNALTTRYLRGDPVDQLFGRVSSGQTNWTLTDNLGSVRDVIDNMGAVVKSVNYDAFGNITSQIGDGDLGHYAWTGRELDVETGLQYNRARYYDSTTGRWISQDPMGFDAGDSNLYRYVRNAPVISTDASGLQPLLTPTVPLSEIASTLYAFAKKTNQEADFLDLYYAKGQSLLYTYLKITGNYQGFFNNGNLVNKPTWMHEPGVGTFKGESLPAVGVSGSEGKYSADEFARLLAVPQLPQKAQGVFVMSDEGKNWAKGRELFLEALKSASSVKNRAYIGPLGILYIKDSEALFMNISEATLTNLGEKIGNAQSSGTLNNATPNQFFQWLKDAGLAGASKQFNLDGNAAKALYQSSGDKINKWLADRNIIRQQPAKETDPFLYAAPTVMDLNPTGKGAVYSIYPNLPSGSLDYSKYLEAVIDLCAAARKS